MNPLPLYKPVDTDRVRREIQSAQIIVELLLLIAAEKESEKPARTEPFEDEVERNGKTIKIIRTPDGRFGEKVQNIAPSDIMDSILESSSILGVPLEYKQFNQSLENAAKYIKSIDSSNEGLALAEKALSIINYDFHSYESLRSQVSFSDNEIIYLIANNPDVFQFIGDYLDESSSRKILPLLIKKYEQLDVKNKKADWWATHKKENILFGAFMIADKLSHQAIFSQEESEKTRFLEDKISEYLDLSRGNESALVEQKKILTEMIDILGNMTNIDFTQNSLPNKTVTDKEMFTDKFFKKMALPQNATAAWYIVDDIPSDKSRKKIAAFILSQYDSNRMPLETGKSKTLDYLLQDQKKLLVRLAQSMDKTRLKKKAERINDKYTIEKIEENNEGYTNEVNNLIEEMIKESPEILDYLKEPIHFGDVWNLPRAKKDRPKIETTKNNPKIETTKDNTKDNPVELKINPGKVLSTPSANEVIKSVLNEVKDNPLVQSKAEDHIEAIPYKATEAVLATGAELQKSPEKVIDSLNTQYSQASNNKKVITEEVIKGSLSEMENNSEVLAGSLQVTNKTAALAFKDILKSAREAGAGIQVKIDAAKSKAKEIIDLVILKVKEKGKETLASIDLEAVEKVKTATTRAVSLVTLGIAAAASFGMGGWIGLSAGEGVTAGATALAGLAGIPAIASMIGRIAGISLGGLISLFLGGNLFLKEWLIAPKAASAVEKAFEGLKSAIEKTKQEQEVKQEKKLKKDLTALSASAMDYLAHIYGIQ